MTASRLSSPHGSIGGLALALLLLGCGGTASEPEETSNESTSTGAETAPAVPVLADPVLGDVSWEFFEPLRIDPEGNVYRGHTRVGRFEPNGDFVDEGGGIVRLEPDGTLVLDGDRTNFRIVGSVVFESTNPLMRIEQNELFLLGAGDEADERVTVEGFHPARTRHVLMASTLMLIGMAAAYAH
jgi:hypothetical protein